MNMTSDTEPWDAFISYASEDRESVAKPLAELLTQLGLRVWYDQSELKIGDSLRQRVDEGLARCRYGIVILSEPFFGKHYPERELNGLAQREIDGRKVILPVWNGIDAVRLRQYSPPLADRIAVTWETGIYDAAFALLRVIRPEIVDDLQRRIRPLPIVSSGARLSQIVGHAHGFLFLNGELGTAEEAADVARFLQQLQDWGDLWSDLEAGERVQAEFSIDQALQELVSNGWQVFGDRVRRKMKMAEQEKPFDWDLAAVAVLKEPVSHVFLDGNSILFVKGEMPAARGPDASNPGR